MSKWNSILKAGGVGFEPKSALRFSPISIFLSLFSFTKVRLFVDLVTYVLKKFFMDQYS